MVTLSNKRAVGNRPLSLRSNFSWTFVGNVVYAACQWGMLVALAKLGTPEIVGQFALALAVTAPVIFFANLSLRAVQATDAKQEYQFADYLGLRLITTSLAFIVIGGIAVLGGYRQETVAVIISMGLAKSFESLSDIHYGLFQQRERMDRIAKSMMIKGPFSLVALALGVWLTGSVIWGVLGLAMVWLAVLVGYDLRSARIIAGTESRLRPRWDVKVMQRIAWLALPLGFATMLISLNANIPRYIIERTDGEAQLGFFAAIAYLMVAGRTVVAALGQSASPRLSQHFAVRNNRAFTRLLLRLVAIALVLGASGVLVAVLAGEWVLTLLYKAEYAEHSDVFVLLMVAAGIMYIASFLGYGMTAARKFRVQLPLFGVIVINTALFCMLLIPEYGLKGAGWALIASSGVQLMGSLGVVLLALKR